VAQERTVFTNGCGVALRWPGQASGVHGGGEERHVGHKSGNHTWHDPIEYDEEGHYVSGYEDGGAGQFDGQLVSVLLALNDSPIGGGNTALVPGSEFVSSIYQDRLGTNIGKALKKEWRFSQGYPQLFWGAADGTNGGYMDGMPGAIELPMEAGDALICTSYAINAAHAAHSRFASELTACILLPANPEGVRASPQRTVCELCTHGSNVRTIPGHRRMCILRYSPKETANQRTHLWAGRPQLYDTDTKPHSKLMIWFTKTGLGQTHKGLNPLRIA
jgi:hypothetical protein